MGNVAFEALTDPPRLRVADTVGNEQYELHLESPVDPEPISTDGFRYPVSDAVRVEISGFELPGHVRMHLWDDSGGLLHEIDEEGEYLVPSGEYSLEFCRALKTYIGISGSPSVEVHARGAQIRFESSIPVEIGARSPRKQPADSITTTGEPMDIMEALSNLGEGLLTTTPMRAYPNLRGYPPEIELGDELHVPDNIDTGAQPVTVAVPPDLPYLYEAAPLIYYLSADVQPGPRPELLVDNEPIYEFCSGSFADEVEMLLDHILMIDCAVRSAGPYPIESMEVDRLKEVISYDFRRLYRADRRTRLRMYMDVPFAPVASQLPEKRTRAYIEPDPGTVDAIPHLVSRLVPIRAVSPPRLTGADARRTALERFTDTGARARGASAVFDGSEAFVDTGSPGTKADLWVGSDIPISANDFVIEGYRNRFARPTTEQHSIDVTIVCNEPWMTDEAVTVRRHYEAQENLQFDVTIREGLDKRELAELLATETDFFHYVGHATRDGLECTDGHLDVATVPSINVETFLLNACQSYKQAKEMVKGGAIGGIATLSDVTDDQAAVVGRTAARLLNLGYPLKTALSIARSRSVVGGQYLTVGDDSVMLVTTDLIPHVCTIMQKAGTYELTIETYQSNWGGAGGLYMPWLEFEDQGHLIGKTIGPYEMTVEELVSYLELENVPVEFDGEFRWAFDLAAELA